MKAAAFSLVVLTLNAAGPRRAGQGWPTRREAIVARLKAEAPDLVALQEVWRSADLDALSSAANAPQVAADPALGLAVLARGWTLGRAARLELGGGYGALRVEASAGKDSFDAYSARLEPGEGPAAARRLGQLFRLAEFVRAQSAGRTFVLLGDLATSADDRGTSLFLDLLEARDLCVSHGDEVCGRTLGDKRVDYALIPYASRPPKEYARATFTDLLPGDEDEAPLALHFGLRARLDASFLKLKPAVAPAGRDEALAAIEDALEKARADAESRQNAAGWIPFLGTRDIIAAKRESDAFGALVEEVRTARIRAAKRETPSAEE